MGEEQARQFGSSDEACAGELVTGRQVTKAVGNVPNKGRSFWQQRHDYVSIRLWNRCDSFALATKRLMAVSRFGTRYCSTEGAFRTPIDNGKVAYISRGTT